jgi:hypothetical protein
MISYGKYTLNPLFSQNYDTIFVYSASESILPSNSSGQDVWISSPDIAQWATRSEPS